MQPQQLRYCVRKSLEISFYFLIFPYFVILLFCYFVILLLCVCVCLCSVVVVVGRIFRRGRSVEMFVSHHASAEWDMGCVFL